MLTQYAVRHYGDEALRQVAEAVQKIDGQLATLADQMLAVMYSEPGIGLAATQIGVNQRLFVYDMGDGPQTVVNPTITEHSGEWSYFEGCLSIPGLFREVVRPKKVLLTGWDLDEQPVSVEADELLARLFQHELDHLDGILLIDHLGDEERRELVDLLDQHPQAFNPNDATPMTQVQ